jgi:hypothetical protein
MYKYRARKDMYGYDRYLTHALKFFFELSLMFTVCDAEIVVSVCALVHTVLRSCSPDCQHGGRAVSPLCLADLINCHHFLSLSLKLAGRKKRR